ncbi:MAG TPA: methyltransferase domain-containing protein [Alphaproteobacteria bacterium]|nr:methyltransferase domain-containing protein [Alphaproteobacteria bacterium]
MLDKDIEAKEAKIFFKQWLKAPMQLGTLAPISKRLAKAGARAINPTKDDLIVEIGAGTGRWTRALIEQGVRPDQLITVELDLVMHGFLQKTLPAYTHVLGDACLLEDLIPPLWKGRVTKIVSAIPFMYLEPSLRLKIVNACFECLKEGGDLFHLTYNPRSPLSFLPQKDMEQTRVCSLWFNVPPGFVWRYQKRASSFTNVLYKVA